MEGFVFQGLEHIKDHAEVSLNDLSIAGPQPDQPALKGTGRPSPTVQYRATRAVR